MFSHPKFDDARGRASFAIFSLCAVECARRSQSERGCRSLAGRHKTRSRSTDQTLPKTEMSAFFIPPNKPLSTIIAAHRKAHVRKIRVERSRSVGRAFFVYPLIWLAHRLEIRTFRQLCAIHPKDLEEARHKLVYLMAVMMADRTSPDAAQLARAIETLRPHKEALAEHLKRQRSCLADDQTTPRADECSRGLNMERS